MGRKLLALSIPSSLHASLILHRIAGDTVVNATKPGTALPELTVGWHDPASLHESSLTTAASGGRPSKGTSPWHLGRPWAGAAAHRPSRDSSRSAGWEFVGWTYTGSPLGSKLAGLSLPLGCGSAGGPGRLPVPGPTPCASRGRSRRPSLLSCTGEGAAGRRRLPLLADPAVSHARLAQTANATATPTAAATSTSSTW